MSGLGDRDTWSDLWKAYSYTDRMNLLTDAIDYWGRRVLRRLASAVPASDEVIAEVNCLDWVRRRKRWIANLSWEKIDDWVFQNFLEAKSLNPNWSLTRILKDTLLSKVGQERAEV